MTQNKAKILIKIGKYFVIALFVMFFVIIIIQSVQLNNLKSKQTNLQTELENKVVINSNLQNEISNIENNFNEYSEEELRKDNYKKENEDLFTA